LDIFFELGAFGSVADLSFQKKEKKQKQQQQHFHNVSTATSASFAL